MQLITDLLVFALKAPTTFLAPASLAPPTLTIMDPLAFAIQDTQ